MPKHSHHKSTTSFVEAIRRKIRTQFEVDAATAFLLKKVSKLENQIEVLESENNTLKARIAKYEQKKKTRIRRK
jgi:prefoldin subunit 5